MSRRGQANLAALAVAVVLLTVATTASIVIADEALADADTEARERHAAAALAERLAAPDSPTTLRANALDESAVENLTAADVDALAPATAGKDFAIRLDGETVISRGDPAGGTTVRRAALAGSAVNESRDASLSDRVTLSNRTGAVRVELDPEPNTTVHTVRINDRVALYDPAGLSGTATIETTRFADVTVAFETSGDTAGTATVTGRRVDATATTLEVTVDA